jgi:DNA-directed RNA polymerase II subunit RPB1
MADNYHHDGTVRRIDKIDFDILGNDEILEMSAVKQSQGIDVPDLYENLEPKRGGLIDPRMGTTSNTDFCDTCGLGTTYCVGHFGHIELADDVYNILFIDDVKRILDVICLRCSRLLIHKDEPAVKELLKTREGARRLQGIKELTKNVSYCNKKKQGCGAPVYKIKKEIKKGTAAINIISEIELDTKDNPEIEGNKQKVRLVLTPEFIYSVLSNMTPEDREIIGMKPHRSDAKSMIHRVFPVPPVNMRPSVRADFMGGSTREDDLTHRLADIVRANTSIHRKKESFDELKNKYSKDHTHLLQYHVAVFFNNEAITMNKNDAKSRQYKPLIARLKGKEGRVRKNLMGKRGDFSGRSVVTSYPSAMIDEVGVPVHIAQTLTYPEKVTLNNKERLSKLVKRGRYNYPGANIVFHQRSFGGVTKLLPIDLRFRKEEIELKLGDIVERHLVNGDVVLFNRQPTLHKQSIMTHRIRVINDHRYMTYRLPLAATSPYNADFDGDVAFLRRIQITI